MAKTKIMNASSGLLTLPAPWSRLVPAGRHVHVTGTVDEVIAALGGVDAVSAAFVQVSQASDDVDVIAIDTETVINGVAYMAGAAQPNASSGTALPTGANVGLYLVSAGADKGSIWVNVDGSATSWIDTRAAGDSSMFGDGSDGALTVAGTTTEAGELEKFYTDGTIGAAGIYITAGRRVFFNGTLTIASGGVIHNDGAAAVADVAGAGGAAGFTLAGTAGGAGNQAAGSNGAAANAAARIVSPTSHGTGGAGGAGTSAAGAAGVQSVTKVGSGRNALEAFTGIAAIAPGTGGGGGGGDNAATKGGGGGGGGGVVAIIAKRVVTAGAVPVRAKGGAGAAGTAADCGGGGGGGGGAIIIITRQYLGTALTAATHTPGGALGASGGGAGVDGVAGGAGYVAVLSI